VSGEQGDHLLLEGGSRFKTRLFGGFFGSEAGLPVRGRLRIRDRGATVAIELMLAEEWGPGVFAGLGGRYSSHFDKVLADVRRATARR